MNVVDEMFLGVPAGDYALGVSGGADSVALLRGVVGCGHLRGYVVHLNHQLRGKESDGDEGFVRALAEELGVRCTVGKREEMKGDWPGNASAKYRGMRLELFRLVCERERLQGVLLAHHADDQAETVLQRLLRGSGGKGLAGMSAMAEVNGVMVYRPLLRVGREGLREYLRGLGQEWREDTSNESDDYFRNRLRKLLSKRPGLVAALGELARGMEEMRNWVRAVGPVLGEAFGVGELYGLPEMLKREAVRAWLVSQGVTKAEAEKGAVDRLMRMVEDAGVAGTVNLPGGIVVRRKSGMIRVGKR